MQHKLRAQVAAIMLLAPAAATFLAQPAAAQQRATVAPVITSMAVNADEGLSPGSTLSFQLYAAARARKADVVLGKSGIVVPLRERTPGNYTGTYVVRRSDRIDPTQFMAARVTHSQTIARNFAYPPSFQALAQGAGPAPVAVAAAPAIERFVMRPGGRIEAGQELHYRLMGAPGADAWLDIPGVISGVDLAETRPGVYEGNYTVRRRDNLDAFRNAVATLRNGNVRSTAKLDMNWNGWERDRQARDERAPQITDLMPANGERITERGRAHIAAKLSDEGTGVDPASVRLRLAGRDVTADARVTEDEVHYRADLDPGRYTAELTVRDRAGNTTSKAWTFDVADAGRDRDRVGGGALPLQITSHANGAMIEGNGALRLEGRTAPGANVRVQVESVANVGGLLGVTQPVMDQTIQADRNGHFSVAVQPSGLPIPGQRYDVRMTANNGNQTSEERITLQRRG
jgi:hypothetical protein